MLTHLINHILGLIGYSVWTEIVRVQHKLCHLYMIYSAIYWILCKQTSYQQLLDFT